MFSSVSGFHHRGGDPYETGSDTPIPNFIKESLLLFSAKYSITPERKTQAIPPPFEKAERSAERSAFCLTLYSFVMTGMTIGLRLVVLNR